VFSTPLQTQNEDQCHARPLAQPSSCVLACSAQVRKFLLRCLRLSDSARASAKGGPSGTVHPRLLFPLLSRPLIAATTAIHVHAPHASALGRQIVGAFCSDQPSHWSKLPLSTPAVAVCWMTLVLALHEIANCNAKALKSAVEIEDGKRAQHAERATKQAHAPHQSTIRSADASTLAAGSVTAAAAGLHCCCRCCRAAPMLCAMISISSSASPASVWRCASRK